MAHKLSLITEQTINNNGWNRYPGNPYNDTGIEKITDNIGNAEIPVTSIPSPFAQMHLFETSFAFINKRFETDDSILDGKTTYHKYISYCLDIYEMLYNYETLKLKDRISISIWDKKELADLSTSYNSGVKTFAKTLGIFINNYNNDARFKNLGIEGAFDKFLLIYLDNNIIAGSSPYTGFFTVGNDLPKSIKSNSNNRRYFFSNNEPLYKRSIQFQKYMNILFATNAQLISAFKEVNSYIKKNNRKNTDPEFKLFIDKLNKNSEDYLSDDNYKILEINNQEVSFLNGKIPFFTEKFNQEDEKKNAKKSDYIIQTSKSLPNTPLALLEGYENNRWEYLNGVFPKGCKIIPTDPISKRILPETVMEYPWITRNDLLSKHLVQLEYNINTSKYWLPNENVKNILLPIKKEYFNFFTIDDLKRQLSIEKLKSGGITVLLEIPVKANNGKGTMKFERTYSDVKPNTIDSDNYGAIINSSLALGIYPFLKVAETAFNDKYKILSYHEKGEEISYEFFKEVLNEPKIKTIPSSLSSRSRKEENFPAVTNYIDITSVTHSSVGETHLDNNLDITFEGICLTIKNNDLDTETKCLLIPLMGEPKNLVGGNPSIAFDIGTSNSFVSIKTSNNEENISNYNSSGNSLSPHLVMLNEAQETVDVYKSFDLEGIKPFYGVAQNAEFMPTMVGDASLFKFPIRSIVNVDNDVNPETQNSINVLSNTNIPFAFGHNKLRQDLDYVHSNIKWGVTDSSNNAAKNILKGFIEQLVWMGRNKLLSEGFDPRAANVIWFKPLSMSAPQKSIFEDIWKDLHNTYFRKETNKKESSRLISVTESRAPFYAYENDFGSGEIFMNLDIGGGTTDLIVFNDRKPMLSTSFRFAGNSLFESKSTSNPFDNGFVSKYENIMRDEFGEDFAKIDIINYIKNSKGLMSTDLLSYFFNYKSFNEKLKLDTNFKLLFLIHNCAIFYHAMQILKMSELEGIPYYVGTSGNGAKLLEITNGGPDLNRFNGLSTVLQHITKKVHGLDGLPKIEIQILDNPKESTAIGGIKGVEDIKQSPHADEMSYYISVGNESDLVKEQSRNFAYTKFLKQDDKTIEEVSTNVVNFFIYFFDELWYDTNVIKNFGVDASYSSEKLKAYFTDTDKISNTIRDVINHKINIEKETSINETLFFEAIKAYLYAFSKIIVSDKINEFKGAR